MAELFGAELQHNFGWSAWEAQTQGISQWAAVAGSNRLTCGKVTTTLVILTYFKSQKFLKVCTKFSEFWLWRKQYSKFRRMQLQMAARESLKMISGMIPNQQQQNSAAELPQMKIGFWKWCKDLHWLD